MPAPNPIYQATVKELEGVLSPRVASQSLQEGLRKLQKTPQTITEDDLEEILKTQVYKRLQVTLPADRAKEVVQQLLDQLRSAEAERPTDLGAQAQAIDALKEALKPFNLYFEWPETQKLRAQLQLLDAEQQAGRAARDLLREAEEQLGVLEQKLEGQLVTQAQELSELRDILKQVKSLGGPKVRRLDNLIGQIERAQETRQSAPGEVARASKLATDLRKLVASAVFEPTDSPFPQDNPTSEQTARISEELKRLDLESDARELRQLSAEFANLFLFEPALAEHLDEARASLDAQTPLGERLGDLRNLLVQAQTSLRESLQAEFIEIATYLQGASQEQEEAQELEVALPVALGILETTLPARADVQRVRDLYRLLSQVGQAPGRAAQLAELHRIESEAAPYLELDDNVALQLALLLDASRTQLEVGRDADELAQVEPLLAGIRSKVAAQAAAFESRLDAALTSHTLIASLNTDETLQVRRTLQHLDAQRQAFARVSPAVQAQLTGALDQVERDLQELQSAWEATREVAGQLVAGDAFGDLLGLFSTPTDPTKDSATDSE